MLRNILLTIIISFILIGCSKEKRSDKISQDQWKALSYLPYNTYYLMYINLDELRKSNYDNKYLPGTLNEKVKENWLDDLQEKTGVGTKQGISQIFISSAWDENNVVVAFIPRGIKGLSSYFNDQTKFSKQVNGTFTLKDKPTTSFFFPDNSTMIIFNNYDYRDKVLSNNYKSVKENRDFIGLLKGIAIKNSYWMIANDPGYVKYLMSRILGHRLDEAKSLLKNVTGITLALTAGEQPVIESNLKCKAVKDALTLSTAFRTALVMDLFSDTNYELNRILKKTEVDREGTVVSLNLTLNKQDVNQLKEITKNISGNKE